MKMLKLNREIALSILLMMVLICGLYSTSHAAINSIKPGSNDTSLIVRFSWSYWEDMWGHESETFTFKWREKEPQGTWSSAGRTYSVSWQIYYEPNRRRSTTDTFTITGLRPGTTYEVMVDNWEGEGTTSYTALLVSAASPLTEAILDGAEVTLSLSYDTYVADVDTIRNAVSVSGIEGVTIDTSSLVRDSDTQITVQLDFVRSNLDIDTPLTFSMTSDAIANYTADVNAVELQVMAIQEVSASAAAPLTETNLNEGVITLTLSYDTYEMDVSKIRNAITVSGIDGVTVDTSLVQRASDTEITVELDFDLTDFDDNTALTFSLGPDAITDYAGDAFTTDILVTAIKEVVSASVVSPLTEATLDESTVTLLLTGAAFEQDNSEIKNALAVSGINGVTIGTDTLQRLSDRRVTVKLDYDGTDFDTDTALTFNITSGAIANHNGGLSAEISVTAIVEAVSASVVSPLAEETLNGSLVTLKLTGITYEQDTSKISGALTVSGINGVTLDTTTLQRLGDSVVAVELDYDDSDFVRDTALIFNVAADAITNYTSTAFTTELLVTANRAEDLPTIFWTDWGTDKIQRANLDGSNVQDLVTQGLEGPGAIALDVADGKMYWADSGTNKIQRANLDGSNVENLVTQGLEGPGAIALDVEGGKMYWTDWGTDKIQRANLDGSNVEDLVTQGLESLTGIALDVVGGKMYWTDYGTDKIQRANLDGSNVQDLVTQGLDSPRDIALDVVGGKMYWTDYGTDKIQRANLDGSNVQDLITQGLDTPIRITLDVVGGKMYWTDDGTDKIQRANLDGSNVQDLVTQGLDRPSGIVFGVISPVNPTTETVEPTITKEDVNSDGVVDVNDLVVVAQQYGKTGTNDADVNGDEIVNVDDFILVAAALENAAAAPAARSQVQSHFTEAQLQGFLTEAHASGNTSQAYQRGIDVVEQLLALFTSVETALLPNFPNPFNPETWIPYQLSKPTDVALMIYGIKGNVVRTLDLGHQAAGLYQSRSRAVYWDGKNELGEKVASGVYFYTLTADDFSATRKMLIRK